MADHPKDFVEWHCNRCGRVEDYFVEPCIIYSTRDHHPDTCPADKTHRAAEWTLYRVLFRWLDGKYSEDLRSRVPNVRCHFCMNPAKYEGWWERSDDYSVRIFVCEDHKSSLRKMKDG